MLMRDDIVRNDVGVVDGQWCLVDGEVPIDSGSFLKASGGDVSSPGDFLRFLESITGGVTSPRSPIYF